MHPDDVTPEPATLVDWLPPARRAHLYRIISAAAPLAAIYGALTEQALPLWIALAGAVLGTGTAAVHTPTKSA